MSYLFGSTTVHESPLGVAMTVDQGQQWAMIAEPTAVPVVELLPVAGTTGALFALTTQSRTPLALGAAADLVATTAAVPARSLVTTPQPIWAVSVISWLVAASAAAALAWLMLQEWQQPLLATAQTTTGMRFR